MQTKNLIQASANVVKITRLAIGDVVKIVDEGYSSPEIYFGVVIDLLNGGEKSFFPATVEEVKEHLDECITQIERDVKSEERKLFDKKAALERAKEFVSMETSKKLRDASFKEISTQEYLQLKSQATEVF